MERKIGEIFEYNGEWYQCVRSDTYCTGCAFYWNKGLCNDIIGNCDNFIFKKLEKVGEPYTTFVDKTVQNYLLETAVSVPPKDVFTLINNEQRLIAIEIKQKEEDMEEKKLNLKPFDIQKAKEGKPVCTRDGRKARIICFDAKGDKPIIALIENEIDERPCNYFTNGRFYSNPNENNDADLMMLPEKKEGWVNLWRHESGTVHPDGNVYRLKEKAVKIGSRDYNYVATVKIEWEE